MDMRQGCEVLLNSKDSTTVASFNSKAPGRKAGFHESPGGFGTLTALLGGLSCHERLSWASEN